MDVFIEDKARYLINVGAILHFNNTSVKQHCWLIMFKTVTNTLMCILFLYAVQTVPPTSDMEELDPVQFLHTLNWQVELGNDFPTSNVNPLEICAMIVIHHPDVLKCGIFLNVVPVTPTRCWKSTNTGNQTWCTIYIHVKEFDGGPHKKVCSWETCLVNNFAIRH